MLVAAGGDGTVSAVADVLRGSGTALGVLPLGTLNHFAKDLRHPARSGGGGARSSRAGRRVAVDVGEVNGRGFINNASLGLYPTWCASASASSAACAAASARRCCGRRSRCCDRPPCST